ncbi:MAG: ROK family protein [Limnochordaceae bacterium]|nr:ROK family protein [Limnochordaceae bacterium]
MGTGIEGMPRAAQRRSSSGGEVRLAAANIFGHPTVVPQGAPCYCGKRGCLCQYASGPGLVRVANERAGREVVREPREILRQAEVGAKWARETLEFALRLLALALSHAVTLGNPPR